MTNSIILKTGKGQIDLLNPRAEDVNIDDMLRNLSRMYRFTGASPMTVLQHSLYVGHITGTIEGYTHDLHEYCTGDIAAPLLERLFIRDDLGCFRHFGCVQDQIQRAIETRLGLPLEFTMVDVNAADMQSRELELALMADPAKAQILPDWIREILEATPEMVVQMFKVQLSLLGVTL